MEERPATAAPESVRGMKVGVGPLTGGRPDPGVPLRGDHHVTGG